MGGGDCGGGGGARKKNEKKGEKSIEKWVQGAGEEKGGAAGGDREHQSCRLSYLLNCAVLKASDTCRNNAINLMHDVIYLMPYTYKFIRMKNACAARPNLDKGS